MDAYSEELQALRSEVDELMAVAATVGETSLQAAFDSVRERLNGRTFHVAVVGEFKAGKSSLVNALIAREVLPAATRECSAVVTRVVQAVRDEQSDVELLLENGRKCGASYDQLTTLTTVDNATVDGMPVVEAAVFVPTIEGLPGDVEVIDTPGLNAAGRAREKATMEYLPRADAVVFVTRADQLLNEGEVRFLEERLSSASLVGLFVVVNFSDLIDSARDRLEIETRLRERLPSRIAEVPVSFVSATEALYAMEDEDADALRKSGVPDFRSSLSRFLSEHRQEAEVATLRALVAELRSETRRRLSRWLSDATLERDAATRRRSRLVELIGFARSDAERLANEAERRLSGLTQSAIERPIDDAVRRLRSGLQDLNAASRQVSDEQAKRMADEIGGAVVVQIQDGLSAGLADVTHWASDQLQTMFDRSDGLDELSLVVSSEPASFGAMVLVKSYERESVEMEPQMMTRQSSGNASLGAVVGSAIGMLVFGPVGAVAGGALGAHFGAEYDASESQGALRRITKLLTERSVDIDTTCRRFRDHVEVGGREALEAVTYQLLADIRTVTRGHISSLEARLERLNAYGKAPPEEIERVQLALERLGRSLLPA